MPRATKDSKICKGKNKGGSPCKRFAMHGEEYCKTHFVNSGKATQFKPGPLNANFKDGRRSRYQPKQGLMEAYAKAEADPELLNTRPEIALLTVRLQELIANVDTTESGKWWEGLQAKKAELLVARQSGDNQGVAIALNQLLQLIDAGSAEHMVWEEIRGTMLDRDKLVKSERKRLIEMQAFVTAEEGLAMLHQIGLALRTSLEKHVGDLKIRRKVIDDVGNVIRRAYGSAKDAA